MEISGIATLQRELGGKRLELLMEAVPRILRIGVLWEAVSQTGAIGFKVYETAARALKIQLQSMEVGEPNPDFDGAFQTAAKARQRAHHDYQSLGSSLHEANCCARHKTPIAVDVRRKRLGRGWWPHVLLNRRS